MDELVVQVGRCAAMSSSSVADGGGVAQTDSIRCISFVGPKSTDAGKAGSFAEPGRKVRSCFRKTPNGVGVDDPVSKTDVGNEIRLTTSAAPTDAANPPAIATLPRPHRRVPEIGS